MGILSKSNRIESGSHSKLYYGLKDFGYEVWCAKGRILQFSFAMGFLIFLTYHSYDLANGITQIEKEQQKEIDEDNKIDTTVRTSTDCYEINQDLLKLISYGANEDAWMPNQHDSDLKIGQERYGLLGCKP